MATAIGQGVLVLLHSLSQAPVDAGRPLREKLARPHPTAGDGSKHVARVNSDARGGQWAPALDGGSDELAFRKGSDHRWLYLEAPHPPTPAANRGS